jgi:5-formyltetrahydrofolate cyclo-ligase
MLKACPLIKHRSRQLRKQEKLKKIWRNFLKKSLRDKLVKKRDSIQTEKKKIKDTAIRKKLFALKEIKNAESILFYASFRSEVGTILSIKNALKLNRKVILPVVDSKKRELSLYEIKDVAELAAGYMGIPEPCVRRGRKINLVDIDIAIVPGAGFDVKGNRIGYGAGYYDKLLSKAAKTDKSKRHMAKIALAFEEQIVPLAPNEQHDVKMDIIITDKRVIDCRRNRVITNS